MARTFRIFDDEVTFEGHTVATLNPRLSASLRDELEMFLDGLSLTVWPDDEVQDALEAARAEGHAEGLREGYDKGHADGYATGYKAGTDP